MNATRLLAICGLLLIACKSNALDLQEILGKWSVRDVYCRSCPSADRSDIGTKITLSSQQADNPLAGGGCPGVTGYRVVPGKGGSHDIALSKLNPIWPRMQSRPELVAATCDGMDFMLFVVLADGSLVYVPEGEVVFRLGKMR